MARMNPATARTGKRIQIPAFIKLTYRERDTWIGGSLRDKGWYAAWEAQAPNERLSGVRIGPYETAEAAARALLERE